MKHARPVFPLLAAVLLSGVLVLTASAAFGPIILVSHSLPDQPAVEQSLAPAISADGRYTVYSWTSPRQSNPVDWRTDIFLYDRNSGLNQKISLPAGGGEANGDSTFPKISADGRWVAFLSEATNLPGGDTSFDPDIFILDRDTDTDGIFDESGGTELGVLVDISDPGDQVQVPPPFFSMSADGQLFAYSQYRPTQSPEEIPISDICLFDRSTATMCPIIITKDANNSSTHPILSPSGRYVAFSSEATNLVTGDNNTYKDVFLYDQVSGQTIRVSVSNTGGEGNNISGMDVFSNFSADEHWLWFYSDAENLVSNDVNFKRDTFFYDIQESLLYRTQELIGDELPDHLYVGADLLAGGRWLIYSDSFQNSSPFYALNRITRQQLLINGIDGIVAGGTVNASAFSKDGGWVAFESDAEDLVSAEDHPGADIFLRQLGIDQSSEVYLPVLFGQ